MMNISEWQSKVDDWIKLYGVRYFDVKTNALLLAEETGEICRLIARQYGEQSFKHDMTEHEVKNKIEDEIGDLYFVLTCICNQLNINMEDLLTKNIDKKTSRDHSRHQNNKKLQ